MYHTILIPTDGSEGTAHVEMHALDLAEQNDATVHALYVVEESVSGIIDRDDLRAGLEEIGRQATGTIPRMDEARSLETVVEITDGEPGDPTRRLESGDRGAAPGGRSRGPDRRGVRSATRPPPKGSVT